MPGSVAVGCPPQGSTVAVIVTVGVMERCFSIEFPTHRTIKPRR